MSIISRKTAGVFAIIGLIAVLLYVLIFVKSFAAGLALAIIVLLAVIFLYRPLWGFLIFLVIRPLFDKLGESFSVSISRNFSINAAALLGVLVLGLAFLYFFKNKTKIFSIPLFWTWFIFIAISIASLFFSVDKSASFYEIIRALTIFTFFALGYSIYQSSQNPKSFLKAVLISAVVPFSFAFYQLITQTGLGGTSGIDSRLYGTFSHPNAFASFVLIILAVSFCFILDKNTGKKLPFYLIALISLFIIIETFSRGAWLSLLIFAFIISLFQSRKIILLALGLLIIAYFISPLVRDRIEDVYNPPATSSIVWRFQQWEKVYASFSKKPLTGYGTGTETIVFENEYGFYAGNPYTHNDILKAAVEIGIFGAAAYILILALTVFYLFKNYFSSQEQNAKLFYLIILALFIAEIGFSMTSNIFRGTATQWTLWSLIGVALAMNNKKILKV